MCNVGCWSGMAFLPYLRGVWIVILFPDFQPEKQNEQQQNQQGETIQVNLVGVQDCCGCLVGVQDCFPAVCVQ